MSEKEITPNEFEEHLQDFVGRDLTDFHYTTDTLVVFASGNKHQRNKGEKDSPLDSEYELRIWGNWKYEKDGKVVETTEVKPSEDGPKFRNRIADFIESIHPKKITSINVSDDGQTTQISLNNGGKFIVSKVEDRFVNYSHCKYDEDGNFLSAQHVRPEEGTGKLILVLAP